MGDQVEARVARRGLARVIGAAGCTPPEALALAVLLAGALAALGMLWLLGRPSDPRQPATVGTAVAVEALPVTVHVAGAVAAPGLYELPGGARVADALAAAGGATAGAALERVNLARPLADGEQLYVPDAAEAAAHGETVAPGPDGGHGDVPASSSARRPDGTLDLNLATEEDLDELPGIGPVLAARIVAHREAQGGFRSVGALRDVPGIGEKTFQDIAPLVAV